ncbi:MAG TPA: M23 family metallopeptidase [Verrucomicrobiae bacterium]|jgi:murein DD-endopeptidase MepM/ murein hydrolase activator NlpD|nr:M23 family metallopeptidase [Verrucomicrobiae bacterium]
MARTRHVYLLPVPPKVISSIVKDNQSHMGAYKGSIDFAVPVDTSVLAAANGVVTRVCDSSNKYGKDPSFGQDVNYITIEHSGNELSEYLHLAQSSAKVKAGEKVKQGQEIAKTGLSGWLYAPHLHFMVYSKVERREDFQCLNIRFIQPLPE